MLIKQKRVSPKLNRIAGEIREMIVGGEFKPGEAMPTRRDLMERFGVSMVTAQRAMECLEQEGFIASDGRRGTKLTSDPPHLHHYALIFRERPHNKEGFWSHFWEALAEEAVEMQHRRPPNRVTVICGVNPASENHHHLLYLAKTHQLGGIIAPNDFYGWLEESPLLTMPELRMVAFCPPQAIAPRCASIVFDFSAWLDKAIAKLQQMGRRRVAILNTVGFAMSVQGEAIRYSLEEFRRVAMERIQAMGMLTKPHWIQSVESHHPSFAQCAVELLMHSSPSDQPDAIILADDHYVSGAMAGLMACGIKVPGDVAVVAYSNFSSKSYRGGPVIPVGFDIRKVLDCCIDTLEQMRGKPVTSPTALTIQPCYEADLCSSNNLQRSL